MQFHSTAFLEFMSFAMSASLSLQGCPASWLRDQLQACLMLPYRQGPSNVPHYFHIDKLLAHYFERSLGSKRSQLPLFLFIGPNESRGLEFPRHVQLIIKKHLSGPFSLLAPLLDIAFSIGVGLNFLPLSDQWTSLELPYLRPHSCSTWNHIQLGSGPLA